jgi:hypothetical protein
LLTSLDHVDEATESSNQCVELDFELQRRKEEVLLLAPTALSIEVCDGDCDRARPSVKPQIYSLWQGRTVLFIDEISMVSLTMLNTINQQSTAILGALPLVVFMGGFHHASLHPSRPNRSGRHRRILKPPLQTC